MLNVDFFNFEHTKNRRYVDAQYWTKTDYISITMNSNETFFGVNFVNGRIKGYPKYQKHEKSNKYYLRLVGRYIQYGINSFEDKNNGRATESSWTKNDFVSYNLEEALKYCESLSIGSSNKFRLPYVKCYKVLLIIRSFQILLTVFQ